MERPPLVLLLVAVGGPVLRAVRPRLPPETEGDEDDDEAAVGMGVWAVPGWPLYIYGGVGLGKTHILNAIGNQLKQMDKKVIYLSAERFMYQFVKSIKNKDTHKFKEIFRNADVLILDDIQFISGKEVTQEEFFYTFNSLLENQSQVVISCDRSPNELDRIQDRIKSRLSGGLVVDVQPPDIGLRLEILKKRCLAEKIILEMKY